MFGISFAAAIGIGIMAGVSSTIIVVAAIFVSGREQEYEKRRKRCMHRKGKPQAAFPVLDRRKPEDRGR